MWLVTYLNNFSGAQILPVLKPNLEKGGIICFHQLKTPVTIFFKPAIQIDQPLRQHPALRVKSFVDFLFAPRKNRFNDHVLLHVFRPTIPNDLGATAIACPLGCFVRRSLSLFFRPFREEWFIPYCPF